MPFLLRKIRRQKWYDIPGRPGEIRADALWDLKTENDRLSVWVIEDDRANLDPVISGLVAEIYTSVDEFGYALIPLDGIEAAGWTLDAKQLGKTPCPTANKYHRDLVGLTAVDILDLARLIKDRAEKARKLGWEVALLMDEALKSGAVEKAKEGFQESLERNRLDWERRAKQADHPSVDQ